MSKSRFRPWLYKIHLSYYHREQRYNTLDFPTENRVPRNRRFLWILPVKGEFYPLWTPQTKKNTVPLWNPFANRDAACPYWLTQSQASSGHPIYFLRLCIYKSAILFCTLSLLYIFHILRKQKNPTDFIFNGKMKSVGFLDHCVEMCIAVHIINLWYNQSAQLSHFGTAPRYFHTAWTPKSKRLLPHSPEKPELRGPFALNSFNAANE